MNFIQGADVMQFHPVDLLIKGGEFYRVEAHDFHQVHMK